MSLHLPRRARLPTSPSHRPPENRLHSGLSHHTPASVHYGTAAEVREKRATTLAAAFDANPARFRHRRPEPPKLPTIAWINEPVASVQAGEEEVAPVRDDDATEARDAVA